MEKVMQDLGALQEEAKAFVATLSPQASGATLVTLTGDLGAGKTAFVKEVAKVLGVEDVVTSPTFVLEKIYALPHGSYKKLIHIDLYRFEKSTEMSVLELDLLMKDSANLIMIEWPERSGGALPAPAIALTLASLPGGSHSISYG